MRLERAESTRLAWAFVLSLVFHLLAYSGYEAGRRLHIWERVHLPAWMVAPRMLTELFIKPQTARELEQLEKQRQEQQRRQQIPLMFVDVSPAQASPEPPKKAVYYSARNSVAANPDATVESVVPKIDGRQTDVPKTEDIPRTKMFPLRPEPSAALVKPRPEPDHEVKPELARDVKPNAAEDAKPKAAVAPGDITMARPEESAHKGEAKAEPPKKRPRLLSDVPAEQRMAALSGEKMKQEGGVRRREQVSSFDVISSPFGDYDRAVIAAVQERWYALLDEQGFAGERTGKVMVRFHLNSDGSVTEMKQVENTVDFTLALICQSAIRDPAPFAPWPSEMRKEIGAKYREVTFVFYYR